jgi:ligand-binding sensor domain-containing protein
MRKVYVVIMVLLMWSAGHAQVTPVDDPYFTVTTDTLSIHGPRTIIRNIIQDKNGSYWLASWSGIVRFDGNIFTNHTLKEGLRKFHVFSILEDQAGNLWFGTIRGGVYKYDGKSFSLFTTAEGLAGNMVMCMLEDQAGNIWFGTEGGLSCYKEKTFTNYTTNHGLLNNNVYTMVQDKNGKIWFGTESGICYYNTANMLWSGGKTFTKLTKEGDEDFYNVRSMIEDKAGNIWIGSQEGLFRYDGKTVVQLRSNFTGYVYEDKIGNIWLSEGEVGGMSLTKYDGSAFTKIRTNDNQVFGITEDNQGYIWFCTAVGFSRYDGKSIVDF